MNRLPMRPSTIFAYFVSVSVFSILSLVFRVFPDIETNVLSVPSAQFASFLSGSPLYRDIDGQPMIYVSTSSPQLVTNACSGSSFLCLLLALVAWNAPVRRQRTGLAFAFLAIAVYPFTLLVNGCRIALSGWSSYYGDTLLGPSYHDIIHMTIGGVLFLSALIAFNLLVHYALRPSRFAKAKLRHT